MTDQKSSPNRRQLLGGVSALAAAGVIAGAARGQTAEGEAAAAPAPADIAGQSVLITGTSSGFGRLTALHLARNGANVVASMRNLKNGKRPEAQELADIAADENLKLEVVEIDVTKPRQVASGVARAEEIAGGALDVLVNNAGIGTAGPVELNDEQEVDMMFDTNLMGYHRMARAVLPAMREAGAGLLFQVSSQLGRIVLPNIGTYCATKFAVEAMFEAMAYELAPFGVEVTIIQPGGYPTKIWDNGVRNFNDLMDRVQEDRKAAYETHIQMARGLMSGDYSTDPMDVPRAIAEIMATPAGARPLRRPVHPNDQAMVSANNALAQVQAAVLGNGPYASWHEAVAG